MPGDPANDSGFEGNLNRPGLPSNRHSSCSRKIDRSPALRRGRNLVGRSSRDYPSALIARSRPDVDDPIARRRDAHVVLDDNNGVSGLHKTVQLRHQLRYVRRMQTRRGFVEDVQRFAPLRALQFGGELDALSLAAGKLRGRLTQPDISQADLPEDAQRPAKGGVVRERIQTRRLPSSRGRRQSTYPGS